MSEQITDGERAYHAKLVADAKKADGFAQFIQATQGARMHWSAYLAETYHLGQGDRVNDDGTIVRAEPPAE